MRWRSLALAAGLLAMLSGPLLAGEKPLDPADGAAIRGVIERQLDAFRTDNSREAFAYGSYVRRYVPELAAVEGRWTQRVLVVGPDGVPVMVQYVMEKQPDGSWRIDGCVFEQSTEHTA